MNKQNSTFLKLPENLIDIILYSDDDFDNNSLRLEMLGQTDCSEECEKLIQDFVDGYHYLIKENNRLLNIISGYESNTFFK